eukprot:GHVP01038673.1.p1 GENE.GHVP01038673.1~~GHVP01038673.1.p1  ORF type:complete len:600 (-),score=114.34 GHVP01038673.1:4293-6092(-)
MKENKKLSIYIQNTFHPPPSPISTPAEKYLAFLFGVIERHPILYDALASWLSHVTYQRIAIASSRTNILHAFGLDKANVDSLMQRKISAIDRCQFVGKLGQKCIGWDNHEELPHTIQVQSTASSGGTPRIPILCVCGSSSEILPPWKYLERFGIPFKGTETLDPASEMLDKMSSDDLKNIDSNDLSIPSKSARKDICQKGKKSVDSIFERPDSLCASFFSECCVIKSVVAIGLWEVNDKVYISKTGDSRIASKKLQKMSILQKGYFLLKMDQRALIGVEERSKKSFRSRKQPFSTSDVYSMRNFSLWPEIPFIQAVGKPAPANYSEIVRTSTILGAEYQCDNGCRFVRPWPGDSGLIPFKHGKDRSAFFLPDIPMIVAPSCDLPIFGKCVSRDCQMASVKDTDMSEMKEFMPPDLWTETSWSSNHFSQLQKLWIVSGNRSLTLNLVVAVPVPKRLLETIVESLSIKKSNKLTPEEADEILTSLGNAFRALDWLEVFQGTSDEEEFLDVRIEAFRASIQKNTLHALTFPIPILATMGDVISSPEILQLLISKDERFGDLNRLGKKAKLLQAELMPHFGHLNESQTDLLATRFRVEPGFLS